MSVESVPNRRMPCTVKCKILLPKFNTWEQVHLERKKGSLPLFDNAVGGFSAHDGRRYSAIASPLQCNRVAITVQSRRHCDQETAWLKKIDSPTTICKLLLSNLTGVKSRLWIKIKENHSTAYFLPPMIYTPLASPFKAAERTTCLLTRTPETVNTSTRLSAADGFTGMMPVDWTRR